jgi:RHS repeat-associated protein
MKQGTQYYFYHNDHLSSPQKMPAVNGSTVWSAKYEFFGKAEIDSTSSVVNNLRFPGQYYDSETGLYYNFYRYYDAWSGRYLTADPIRLREINPFVYTNDRPTVRVDPFGLISAEIGG